MFIFRKEKMNILESKEVDNRNNNLKEGSGDVVGNKKEEREDPGVAETMNKMKRKIKDKIEKDESGKESDVVKRSRDDLANEGSGFGATEIADRVTVVNDV